MKLLVSGGPDYADRSALWKALDGVRRARGVELVIHCGHGEFAADGRVICGAELLAGVWAQSRGVAVKVVKTSAAALALEPDGVVAFPGESLVADAAEAAGMKVWRPRQEG